MVIDVRLEIEIDETLGTEEEMYEYIEFELGYSGRISADNPFLSNRIEIIGMDID